MFIVKNKKIFLILSVLMVLVSIVFLFVFPLKPSIEFKGGALLDATYTGTSPDILSLENNIKTLNLGQTLIQPSGNNEFLIKTRDLSEAEHEALFQSLSFGGKYTVSEKSFTSIGPSVGSELVHQAILSVIFVILAIILFITYAFRGVSRPVASWKYGVVTIITLLHDIIISAGIFALISHYNGAEIDTLFVLALLTILGLSVHDKIVVFDRIRENLKNDQKTSFAEIVGKSTSQTIVRSINITLTIIFVLIPLYLVGPATTQNFALILSIGLFFGIYSSLFFASPFLVLVEEWQRRKAKK